MSDTDPSGSARPESDEETDSEQVESEWHFWLLAILVVAGVALLVAPRSLLPGLFAYLGALFVLAGVLGWLVKWSIARTE